MLWVEVLNRGVGWQDPAAVAADWADGIVALESAAHRQLITDLQVMRAYWAAATLGLPVQASVAAGMRQWLATVTLQGADTARQAGFELPPLRARRRDSILPSALEVVVSTALVELVVTPTRARGVTRCQGLVRAGLAPRVFTPEEDAAFAAEAELQALVARGWQQCPRLVQAPRLAHYCGKACSNAAFAARKGARDPQYFAAKQANYRDRRKRQQAPAARFSFID